MSADRNDVAQALAEGARTLHATHTLDETLDAIVHTARDTVDGMDHAGISITHRDGTKVETCAATDQLVWDLDTVQYKLGEGPCLSAISSEQPDQLVVVEHMRRDERWPLFARHAVAAGVGAQMGIQLYDENGTIGGLNLYSTSTETVSQDAILVAELFATHAALALGRRRKEDQLTQALDTRLVIGQAVGVVMQTYQLDRDRAFQYLVRVSRNSNTKLREIAREVVDQAEDRAHNR